jgi:hypothetical protein
MTTVLLTERPDALYVRPHESVVRDVLWAKLGSWRLDHALARGTAPDSSAALSLRAHKLIGPRFRCGLAAQLRALPAIAQCPPHPFDSRVPIRARAVLDSLELLEELADRLAAPEPVDPRGVARVQVLLRDGESPLFNPNLAREFRESFEAALEALEPETATDWAL